MTPQKRKGSFMILLKGFILAITCLSFFGLLSCDNAGTGSTSSAAGGSGTGTGWRISINIGNSNIPLGGTTAVVAMVKDSSGAPVPLGTNICFTAIRGGFLKGSDQFATVCETTTNNLGQSIQTYAGIVSGQDSIQVASQGVIETGEIIVN
jgi:hypothetical protein